MIIQPKIRKFPMESKPHISLHSGTVCSTVPKRGLVRFHLADDRHGPDGPHPLPLECRLRQRPVIHDNSGTIKNGILMYSPHCSNREVRVRKKLQEKFEAAIRTPLQRASKRAPTWYSWPSASNSLWSYDPMPMTLG